MSINYRQCKKNNLSQIHTVASGKGSKIENIKKPEGFF